MVFCFDNDGFWCPEREVQVSRGLELKLYGRALCMCCFGME